MAAKTSSKKKATQEGVAGFGYWADERVPDLAHILAPYEIDATAFAAWLGPQLGEYRGMRAFRVASASRARGVVGEDLEYLERVLQGIRAAQIALRPGGEAFFVAPHLVAEAHLRDTNWTEVLARVSSDLVTLQVIVSAVHKRFAAAPRSVGGRPTAAARDALLANVVNRLRQSPRITVSTARELAERVMIHCGIPTPDGPDSTKRATKRVQKLR